MKTKIFILLLFFEFLSFDATAQVTIGSSKIPEAFSVLELDSKSGGLRYPQVTTTQRNSLDVNNASSYGLIVYNSDKRCLEYYAETSGWVNLCSSSSGRAMDKYFLELKKDNLSKTDVLKNKNISFKLSSDHIMSNLRLGKYRDIDNIVKGLEGPSGDNKGQSHYQINIKLSPERLELLNKKDNRKRDILIYALYTDQDGKDNRIELILTIDKENIDLALNT